MKKNLLFLLTLLTGTGCFAQWNKDTLNRNIYCNSNRAYGQLACSDGHKGVIMAWMDQRNSEDRIYMQHVDSNGIAKWAANGQLMSSPTDQWAYDPVVLSDGNGGAVIFFDISVDGGAVHIYAQRVDAKGNELWTKGGVPVSIVQDSRMRNTEAPATNQASPDGEGGAFITWQTYGPFGISVQHIDKNGNAVWPANGISVTNIDSTNISYGSNIINTGNGTAAVAWGYNNSLFMQRISAAGGFLWTPLGLRIADSFDSRADDNAAYLLFDSTVATKNVTVAWADSRNPLTSHDIYAQKIDLNGNFLWKNKGLPVITSKADDVAPSMLIDGKGGFYAICDSGNIACLQHVDKNGIQLWGEGIRPDDGYNGINPVIADDGSGGIIAMWNVNAKLYAQKYNYGGIAQWRAGGTPVISSRLDSMQVSNNHTVNPIISLEDGTAIAVWSSHNGNIFAAKFGGIDGLLPISFLTFTVECQKQAALLQWATSQEVNSQYFEVQTSSDGLHWATITTIASVGTSNTITNYSFTVANPQPTNQLYRLAEYDNNGQKTYSKIISTSCIENIGNISLYPNPATNVLNVSTTFAADVNVQLTIYSILGAAVHSQQYHATAGANLVPINVQHLTSGTYVLVIKDKAGKTLYTQHFVKL